MLIIWLPPSVYIDVTCPDVRKPLCQVPEQVMPPDQLQPPMEICNKYDVHHHTYINWVGHILFFQ
jgi:hypothetical protein